MTPLKQKWIEDLPVRTECTGDDHTNDPIELSGFPIFLTKLTVFYLNTGE